LHAPLHWRDSNANTAKIAVNHDQPILLVRYSSHLAK
jgi:hypothetical protein